MPFLDIGDAWKYYDMGHMTNYEFLQLNSKASLNYSAKKTHQQKRKRKRKRKRKLKTDPSLTRQVKNQLS